MSHKVQNSEDRVSHDEAHFCLFTEVDSPVPEEAEEEVCDIEAALNCLRLFAIPALTGPALTPAGKQWLCDRYAGQQRMLVLLRILVMSQEIGL